MTHCIGPRWVDEKLQYLESNGLKIGKMKKFREYDPFTQSSILQIAENVGNIVGLDSVTIEPGSGDIRFIDEDVYYLEVKSPSFFKSKYGGILVDAEKDFLRILGRSKSRFAVAYSLGSSLIPIHVEDVNKGGRRASLGIHAIDTSFVPTPDVIRKLEDVLFLSNKQLGRIGEKAWKIFVLDITQYPARGSSDFRNLVSNAFWCNRGHLKAIDGIALFAWNPAQRDSHTLPSSLIPVALKGGVRSTVFRQEFQLYGGMMVTMPVSMYAHKGWNSMLQIDKEGFIGVDGVQYGPYWDYVKALFDIDKLVSSYRSYQNMRLLRKMRRL